VRWPGGLISKGREREEEGKRKRGIGRARRGSAVSDFFGVFLARELVHGRVLHDLLPSDLPCLLDDPGE
jgi:hypothetical protein